MKAKDVVDVTVDEGEDMPEELHLDWTNARPNPYAGHISGRPMSVLLDPDVAEVFTSPAAVNKALRALIEAMPTPPKRKRAAKTAAGRPQTVAPSTK